MELAAFPPAREAKPALSRQQYGETLAGATATNTGKLHDMRTARFLPISAPSLTRDGWRRGAMVFTSLGLALLVAITDSASGGGYHLELLYFGPIALASWMSGRLAGLAVVAVSVASWHVVHGDLLAAGLGATPFLFPVAAVVRPRAAPGCACSPTSPRSGARASFSRSTATPRTAPRASSRSASSLPRSRTSSTSRSRRSPPTTTAACACCNR